MTQNQYEQFLNKLKEGKIPEVQKYIYQQSFDINQNKIIIEYTLSQATIRIAINANLILSIVPYLMNDYRYCLNEGKTFVLSNTSQEEIINYLIFVLRKCYNMRNIKEVMREEFNKCNLKY